MYSHISVLGVSERCEGMRADERDRVSASTASSPRRGSRARRQVRFKIRHRRRRRHGLLGRWRRDRDFVREQRRTDRQRQAVTAALSVRRAVDFQQLPQHMFGA